MQDLTLNRVPTGERIAPTRVRCTIKLGGVSDEEMDFPPNRDGRVSDARPRRCRRIRRARQFWRAGPLVLAPVLLPWSLCLRLSRRLHLRLSWTVRKQQRRVLLHLRLPWAVQLWHVDVLAAALLLEA